MPGGGRWRGGSWALQASRDPRDLVVGGLQAGHAPKKAL